VSRASGAAAAAAAAFASLAGLIASGELTSLDQWAVGHAMPGADFRGKPTLLDAIVPLLGAQWHGALHIASELVSLPASFTPATAIVAAACLAMRGRAGVALAVAYAAGNLVEVVVKGTLTRPPLYAHGMHLSGFDSSYPSGHTIRTVLVGLAVAWAWPRLAPWAAAWAVASIVLLELGGQHVPSDIAGGLLVAAALVATTWSWRSGPAPGSRRPSPASRPSARAR
jgi:membrane-associated phospholipid phosphatase